jgi:transcriptional regulator with XRE-family HTH domain
MTNPPPTQPAANEHTAILAEARREALRALLRREGITLTGLARRAGIGRINLLCNFMAGRTSSLSVNTLARIKEAFPHTDLMAFIMPSGHSLTSGPTLEAMPADQADASGEDGLLRLPSPASSDLTIRSPGSDQMLVSVDPLMDRLHRVEQENQLLKHLLALAWARSGA